MEVSLSHVGKKSWLDLSQFSGILHSLFAIRHPPSAIRYMAALLKLTFIFVGIVLLLSRKWNLGLVLLLASVAIGLLFGYPLVQVGRDVLLTTVDPLTLRLALAVVMILTLGELLRQTAGLKGIVESLQALIPNGGIVIAALPALIGLLPMIGGAMFSAPMVDEVGNHLDIDQERKTFINYWFRHIWEYIFPLYPSMMLAAALLGLTTTQLTGAAWPLTVAAVVGGLLFGLLGLPRRGADEATLISRWQNLRTLATSVWPVVLVILLSLTLPIDERFTLIVSALVTIVLMVIVKRFPLRDLWTILCERIPWQTVVVIFGALIFRRVLENSGAVLATSDALTALHVPLAAVTFAVTFIAGLLTGVSAAAFSIGFPVVLPLVVADGSIIAPAWAAWLMAGGFLGVMFSPVHLCLSLTRVYFGADWGPIYRRIVPSALLVAATAAGILLLM
jgi:integral membrane protein (TIGR00529 family)